MAKEGLRKWFSRNKGKGWDDCKTGKPCGRKKREKRKALNELAGKMVE